MYGSRYGYVNFDDAFSVNHFITHVLIALRVRPPSFFIFWKSQRTPVSNFAPTNGFVAGTWALKWFFRGWLNTSSNMMSRICRKEVVKILRSKNPSYTTKSLGLWRALFSIQILWVTSMRYFRFDSIKMYFSGYSGCKKNQNINIESREDITGSLSI